MSADDLEARPHRNKAAADIPALENEIQLEEIRDGLASQPAGSDA